jgi:hypothetical protein
MIEAEILSVSKFSENITDPKVAQFYRDLMISERDITLRFKFTKICG